MLENLYFMESKPDYLFILPWHLKDAALESWLYLRMGGKLVAPIPVSRVYDPQRVGAGQLAAG
jgi:hypothetical protein